MSNTSVVVILAVSQIYIEQNQRKFENKLKNDPLGKGDIEIIISPILQIIEYALNMMVLH